MGRAPRPSGTFASFHPGFDADCAITADDGTLRCGGNYVVDLGPRTPPPTPGRYLPLEPYRILDTRIGLGTPPIGPGQLRVLEVVGAGRVPADATSVVLNVTITGPTEATDVRLWPYGASVPTVSNLNAVAGETVANLVVAELGAYGNLYIRNQSGVTQLIADVVGYHAPSGDRFTGLQPTRILDTRKDLGLSGTFGPGETRDLQVTGIGGVPADATAAVLNVTVTGPTAATDIRLWPAGEAQPNVSNLNAVAGQTIPNLVIATIGADGKVSIRNQAGDTHLIADVVGYHSPTGATYREVDPTRILDTRTDLGLSGAFGPAQTRDLQVTSVADVPADATSVVLNVTVTGPSTATDIRLWPAGSPQPDVSNLNAVAGQTIPNLVIATIGTDGKVAIRNQAGGTHVIADVIGYHTTP